MNSYAAVIDFLMARRLVHPAAIVRQRFRVYDVSRRNHNLQVEFDGGRGYFLKIGADPQRRSSLAQEAEAYGFLSSVLDSELSDSVLVKLRLFDAESSILVLDLLKSENLRALHLRLRRFVPGLAARLGRSLGRLHRRLLTARRLPRDCGFFYPLPFQLPRPTSEFINTCSAANLEFLRILQTSDHLCGALESLSSMWQRNVEAAACLIHGDIRLENCCVTLKPRTLRIIDWELAARGDPAWDTGAALADLLSGWLMSVPLPTGAEPAQCLPFADLPLDSLKRAGPAFWSEYAEGRGLTHSERADMLRTSVLYAAARLIQLAFEHLQSSHRLTMQAVSHLQLSDNLFRRPVDGAAQLLGIAV